MASSLSLRSLPLLPRSQSQPSKPSKPNSDHLKQKLISKGVTPTPRILHALRKKEAQKSLRKFKKQQSQSESQTHLVCDDDSSALLETVKKEYRAFERVVEIKKGRPWERGEGVVGLKRGGGEYLEELREVLEERNGEELRLLLLDDDDVEGIEEGVEERGTRSVSVDEKIQFLVKKLSSSNLSAQDWKFSRVMKQSCIMFSETHLLKIIERLGVLGKWRLAMSVVEWVYSQKDYIHKKSRFVYTKLISVLGKARRPTEACQIFSMMQEDGKLYPDMAAYHAIAVTLGQAGLVDQLLNIIQCMRQKPTQRIKNMKHNDWDPHLEPDAVIYNSVLNACVPCHQWKGVSWVLKQMIVSGLTPTETTYGLAMEVMLKAGKYNLVHKYFEIMKRGGLAIKALTYKVLVRTFWEEGKADKAVETVRDMEWRGVIGTASVYYELACCLCNKGRWRDAVVEVEKLKRLPHAKPLEVTFTGMIQSTLDGGHSSDCISIFEYMKDHCTPNIGTINAMLKVYGRSDMFSEAKELFASIKDNYPKFSPYLNDESMLMPDACTYNSMLEASAAAHQWEYFEYVYKEMILCGFQIDQSKLARLLVAASRAGKCHLLEHAIDSLLEAGEIPRVSLFTEIICLTIVQEDFERTVALINGMAYASIQVSERQWMNTFHKNKDRLDKQKLQNLLNHLNSSSNLAMEDPVPNFIRSLKSYEEIPPDSTLVLGCLNQKSESRQVDSILEVQSNSIDLLIANTPSSFSKLPSASDVLEKWKQERIKNDMFTF